MAVLSLPQAGLAQWNGNQIQPATALSPSVLIQPAELVKALQSARPKPLILNVGPKMLYLQAHIPGAEYIGPGSARSQSSNCTPAPSPFRTLR